MRASSLVIGLLILLSGCGASSLVNGLPAQPTQHAIDCPTGKAQTFQIASDQSSASYQVTEQFVSRDLPDTVTGTTNSVQGMVELCTANPPLVRIPMIQVDLRTLKSDSARRDSALRDNWLQSNTYPYATFVSTAMLQGPPTYVTGQEVTYMLVGNLTIHGTTRSQTFSVKGKVGSDSTLTGTATTTLFMADYGFDPPSVAGILTVKDGVTVTFNFTAH